MAIWLFLRLEFGPTSAIGPHRAAILEAIDRYGSISRAAPAVDITFRQLWRQVQTLNSYFKEPLIGIRRNGRLSGAFLTPTGKDVVARYREMERLTNQTLEKHYRAFEAAVGIDPNSPQLIPRSAQVIDPVTVDRTTGQKKVRKAKLSAARNAKAVAGRRVSAGAKRLKLARR